MSGSSTGATVGMVLGAIVGAILAAPTGGMSLAAGLALGASLGALDTALTPVLPRQPCPPGMSALLRPLLGLPFQLGARDPHTGFLDCGGVVRYALRHGLGVTLPFSSPYQIDLHQVVRVLPPVWLQRGGDRGSWLKHVQPWDVLVWYDSAGESALQGAVDVQLLGSVGHLLHVGLAINRETLVSASVTHGVSFFPARQIADLFGEDVGGLLRVPGVGPWEPVRQPTPQAPGNPFEVKGLATVW
jgi:hypothetical protein